MHRENYSKKDLSVFDTVGTFFIDQFYNSLYLKAREHVNHGKADSLTDAYYEAVSGYANGIRIPKFFKMTIMKLPEYYRKASRFDTITFPQFEDKMLSSFIPPEYYRDFTSSQKDQTLFEIIVKTVQELAKIMLRSDSLRLIIDDHQNPNNIPIFQDQIVDVFILQREDYYAKFAAQINKKDVDSVVSVGVLKKLKDYVEAEIKRRVATEDELTRALQMIKGLMMTINKERMKTNELTTENNKLSEENETLKIRLDATLRQLTTVERQLNSRKIEEVKPKPPTSSRNERVISDDSDSSDEESTARKQAALRAARKSKSEKSFVTPVVTPVITPVVTQLKKQDSQEINIAAPNASSNASSGNSDDSFSDSSSASGDMSGNTSDDTLQKSPNNDSTENASGDNWFD